MKGPVCFELFKTVVENPVLGIAGWRPKVNGISVACTGLNWADRSSIRKAF